MSFVNAIVVRLYVSYFQLPDVYGSVRAVAQGTGYALLQVRSACNILVMVGEAKVVVVMVVVVMVVVVRIVVVIVFVDILEKVVSLVVVVVVVMMVEE